MPPPEVTALRWRDPPLVEIPTPKGRMRLTLGVGSALSRRPGDPPGRVWGLGDRGPNIKVSGAIKRYGLRHLELLQHLVGAKVLPLPDFQPQIAELQVHEDRIELLRTLPLTTPDGSLSGRALPGSAEAAMEPTFDLAGHPLNPDPNGIDSEGLAALADGGFWISEEYGPSLLRVAADGIVTARWTPKGLPLPGAEERLPAKALLRRLNRGFEGLAISADERWLYVVFQSALAGDDPLQTTIWKLDALDGALAGTFAYPFDAPEAFRRDATQGEADVDDLKACELVCIGPDQLLVLERITRDARIYRVDLRTGAPLTKTLIFTTDDHPQLAPDLEGVAMLSDQELLLVTDNDFGIEGAETRFYRLRFGAPLWTIGG